MSSKGISYLAAYRLTRSKSLEQAYLQALQEIANADQQAASYAAMVKELDKQILEYDKMRAKLISAKEDGTTDMDAILQAEVALAQVNQRNAANRVSVYKTADEVFDAPSRVDAMITSGAADRSATYSSTSIGSLKNVIATDTDVFVGLTPEQALDAGIRYFNAVMAEDSTTGNNLANNNAELEAVKQTIASMAGVAPNKLLRSEHRKMKEDYISTVMKQATGGTKDLRDAIKAARGDAKQAKQGETFALQQVAIAAAADGFDEADNSLLRTTLLEIQDSKFGTKKITAADIVNPAKLKTKDGTEIDPSTFIGKKYSDLDDAQKVALVAARGKPTSIDQLFQSRIIMADPQVVKAKQIGDQLTTINKEKAALRTRRAEALQQQATTQATAAQLRDPMNLRERQAEFAAMAMTPEERSKYLTPEQMRRIASMERKATTPAQREQTKGLKLPTGMTLDDLSAFQAMTTATNAAKQGKKIPMNEVEEDSYRALSSLVKDGTTSKQDIYKKAFALANEMGGLPEARRAFAQTVASRIYLDLYEEQQASLPEAMQDKAMKDVRDTLGRGATARKSPAHKELEKLNLQPSTVNDEQVLQNLGNAPMDTPVRNPEETNQ